MKSEWEDFKLRVKNLSLELDKFEVKFLDRYGFKEFCDNLNDSVNGYGEICVTGYFSETIRKEFDKILSYMRTTGSGKVRLMCQELDLTQKRDKKNFESLKKIAEAGAEIKVNNRLHARFLVAYTKANLQILGGLLVIGSFDFNQECIGLERYDAGIETRHPDLVKSAIELFEQLWNEEQSENLLKKYKVIPQA